jgi:NAD+ diphosphatase
MVAWQNDARFCPSCGQPTVAVDHDWGRVCGACGKVRYPPVSPAVLALIHDGDRILMARKPGWGTRYSIFAGFVEPGESLEDCVRREVMEEAGVVVEGPVYKGSQPWPYPHQLMVGFFARYASGEVRIDETELDDARWFHVDQLPDIPPPLSLSRQLIDLWIASRR